MIKAVANFILYQAAWFAAVLGGAHGWPIVGSLPALVVVAIYLWLHRDRWRQEALLIAEITLLGLIAESIFVGLGALHYANTSADAVLPPIWIVALWFAFGTLPLTTLKWLSHQLVMQVLLGAIGGPLSYLGGARLGAATIGIPLPASLAIIGVGWALAIVLMFQMADRTQHLSGRV